jgi:hypothetical protein
MSNCGEVHILEIVRLGRYRVAPDGIEEAGRKEKYHGICEVDVVQLHKFVSTFHLHVTRSAPPFSGRSTSAIC